MADLVELCFADTLDQEGYNYLRQMRAAASSSSYWRLVDLVSERNSMPLNGFVWEEDGVVVGNLSLIPYAGLAYSYYLIANVAVHPEYRRRGIARRLTTAAIEQARRRRAQSVWLHVRAENNAANDLYRSLGFVERASRTTWHSKPDTTADLFLTAGSSATSYRENGYPYWAAALFRLAGTADLAQEIVSVRPGVAPRPSKYRRPAWDGELRLQGP